MTSSVHPTSIQLSAVLPFIGSYDLVRNTIEHLRRQTIAHNLEVVLVKHEAGNANIPAEWADGFAAGTIVEMPAFQSRSHAFAEGVRHSNAEYIVFCEDHCFPEPQWAAALLNRLQTESYSVVAPVFYNANPDSGISWADILIAYGPFVYCNLAEERPYLPGHNASYRKSELLCLPDLGAVLENEYILHQEFVRNGKRLFFEPLAKTHHTNFATMRSFCTATFLAGRLFGGTRAAKISWIENMKFLLLSGLVPLVRLNRVRPAVRRVQSEIAVPVSVWFYLGLGYSIATVAEVWGTLFGIKNVRARLLPLEFNRLKHAPSAAKALAEGRLQFP